MDLLVYSLCAATTLACTILLYRGYRNTGARFLLLCSVFFALITVENGLLILDRVTGPQVDLSLLRTSAALLALLVLNAGMIWERK
jgi:hypothetical protein